MSTVDYKLNAVVKRRQKIPTEGKSMIMTPTPRLLSGAFTGVLATAHCSRVRISRLRVPFKILIIISSLSIRPWVQEPDRPLYICSAADWRLSRGSLQIQAVAGHGPHLASLTKPAAHCSPSEACAAAGCHSRASDCSARAFTV